MQKQADSDTQSFKSSVQNKHIAKLKQFIIIICICAAIFFAGFLIGIFSPQDQAQDKYSNVSEGRTVVLDRRDNLALNTQPRQDIDEKKLSILPLERNLVDNQDAKDNICHVIYKQHLLNLQTMILKFVQNQNFQDEILVLRNIDNLPSQIRSILNQFFEYNEKYIITPLDIEEITLPRYLLFLKNFIKIRKHSGDFLIKENIYKELLSKLEILIKFFYSDAFETACVSEVK